MIFSFACGAHACHASIAAPAEDHGQVTLKNVEEAGIGWVANVNCDHAEVPQRLQCPQQVGRVRVD